MILKKKIDSTIFYIISLSLFSFFFNQHFGNIGINPIDSFFSFNAGYDILNGHYPFKDYWTIAGPFIAFTQASLFKIFGVSWSSYVFQASIYNVIFVLSTFYVFTKFNLNVHFCFLYSFFLSILAYPSIGTPYVDHQSTYLSVISIYIFILALKTNLKIYWLLLPIIIAISFLTKQAPTAHIFIIITLLSIIYFIFNFNIKKILFAILGSLLILIIFFSTLFFADIPFSSFLNQYILFPISLGESRLEYLFPLEFNRIIGRYKLLHLSFLLPFTVIIIRTFKDYKYLKSNEFLILFSLLLMYLAIIVHQLMTINGLFIFFLIPILSAFSHIYYLKYFKDKKYILFLLLILSVSSTIYYTNKYILSRNFNDLNKNNISNAINAEELDKKLDGLKWITYLYPDNPKAEIYNLKESINIIKNQTKRKMIITDYQFISVILSLYDYSPSQVWFSYHVNPEKDSKYFNIHKKFFFDRLKENKIKIVYLVKPLWGGNDIFEKNISKNCYIKNEITKILVSYSLNKCDDLKN